MGSRFDLYFKKLGEYLKLHPVDYFHNKDKTSWAFDVPSLGVYIAGFDSLDEAKDEAKYCIELSMNSMPDGHFRS